MSARHVPDIRLRLAEDMAGCGIPLADRLRLYARMVEYGWSSRELMEHGTRALCLAAGLKKQTMRVM
jgi:hypothetical protein